ncbi:hypothetical protein RIF29_23772 [Crotalaria pallida]|uniref:Uncharacterized protein n=1 Tax=Crotalaria pallida TaxID=3830 RepID=A0AAN9IB62_CROPI
MNDIDSHKTSSGLINLREAIGIETHNLLPFVSMAFSFASCTYGAIVLATPLYYSVFVPRIWFVSLH